MRYDEYRAHDAIGLAHLVADKQLHPTDLLAAALARCEQVDPALNAVSLLMAEVGRATAANPIEGAFAGVPFLIKDLSQDYAGYPTASGTRALQKFPAGNHSIMVRRWIEAGLVIFGKTTVPELGIKPVTETSAYGATRNPWDLHRSPGGSSGGSATAVAAGIVPVAGGNDGGGSIRIPAAWTGLFGLKPGRGLLPCGTKGGDYLHGLATEGVLSRSVRDTAAMLDILAGPDPGARYRHDGPGCVFADAVTEPPRRLRIGVASESPIGTTVHSEAVRATEHTAALLESLGHHIDYTAPEFDGRALAADFTTIWSAHVAADVAQIRRRTGAAERDFAFDTRVLAAAGRTTPAHELVAAYERWNDYTRALADFHEKYDLLLTPTVAEPAPRIGQLETPPALKLIAAPLLTVGAGRPITHNKIFRDHVIANLAVVPFTQLANITGRPAMNVPLYRTPDGLPLGTQLIGGPGSEYLLLQLAAQLEIASPWAHLEPPEPVLDTPAASAR
ncbi:putative amidase [Nocardia brasiliensis NBRC 14402]|uniref:amidase n=1 Tax=Nocardia brasiliensis TaxID=37326 RepID=UPI0002E0366F|nr:amidase [Nocardia brasiliensis]ASF11681.1 amidase [Nocardia brasiliensis]GAJ82788.1 putative amidase [Nocardia brasiliensis NBRC 14402]SUB09515.1 6-aminohexanoate-cyclic-dimer hydrolase [Nocardia brasiliensis]